jgi:hypothetical protein
MTASIPPTPALQVENLYKTFAGIEVLKGVSLTAEKHDVISIIGSSGPRPRAQTTSPAQPAAARTTPAPPPSPLPTQVIAPQPQPDTPSPAPEPQE